MSPETTNGGPPAGPATVEKITATARSQDQAQGSRAAAVLVAHALVLLAGPDAVFDRLLVRHCPVDGCAYGHLHYVPVGSWRQALVRAPRCRPWLRYRIEVVDVLPAAVVAGQRRRGAA